MIDLYVDGGSSTPHYSDFASAVADLGVGVTVNDDVTITGKENGTLITSSTVLIDHGDGSHYTVKLTVDAGYRITDALKTTPVSKAVADGGFFGIVQNSDCVRFRTGSNIIIEHLYVSTGTGTSSRCFELYTTAQTGDFVVRNCVCTAPGSGSQILGRASNPGGTINFIFHNNAFYNVGADALNLGNGDITNYVYCNTIHNCGTYGVYHSGTTTYTYGNVIFKCGTATLYGGMSDDSTNLTDDGARSSTNVSHWAAYIRNGNPGEEDLRVVESREWCADLLWGIGFEMSSLAAAGFTSVHADTTIETTAKYFGDNGLHTEIDSTADRKAGLVLSTAIEPPYYGTLVFRIEADSVADGDEIAIANFGDPTLGDGDFSLLISRSGSNYYCRGYYWNPTGAGTNFQITPGTWYKFRWYVEDHDVASKELSWWVAAADGSFGAAKNTWSNSWDQLGRVFLGAWSIGSAPSGGGVEIDHLQLATTIHDIPDGSTTPYGNNATTTYNDKTDQSAALTGLTGGAIGYIDIQGDTRPTGNTWLAGAFDVEGAGGVSLAGTVAGSGAVSGAVTVSGSPIISLAGTVAGSLAATGGMTVKSNLAGTVGGSGSVSGAMTVKSKIAGTTAGSLAVTGAMTVASAGEVTLAGTTAGSLAVDGALTVSGSPIISMAGTVAGSASVTGAMTVKSRMAGTVDGSLTATGSVQVTGPVPLAGTSSFTFSATGSLSNEALGTLVLVIPCSTEYPLARATTAAPVMVAVVPEEVT